MNRHRQGPAKELPTSLFRAPRNRLTPTLLRCRIRIDCGFRNRLLLGLAIWFSKTESPACCRRDFVLPSCLAAPHSTSGAAFFISNRLFCQATVAASASPLRLDPFRRGARNLLRFRLPCQPASSTLLFRSSDFRLSVRGGGFYHRRVGCQLRSLTSYFVFHFFSAGASVASATSPFLPRGRGFYHHRVGSQPRSADPVFRCSTEPSYPPLHPFHSGAAAPLRQPVGRREAIPNALLPGRQILNCDDLIPRAAPRRFL